MYFDKSWNKICNKHLGLHMYRYGRNNDWPCRQIETQNWVHLSLVLYQLSYMYMCNVSATFCVLGFWSAWFSWRGVDQKSLAWGDELFGGGDLTSVTVTFPKIKTTEENRKNINLPGHISTNHRWGFLSCGQESRSGGSQVSLHPIPLQCGLLF